MSNLGVKAGLNTKDINAAKEFIRLALYIGEERQAYIGTRFCLHESQKNNAFIPIPPNLDSVTQPTKKTHY